jgi:hypothetical protein
MPSSAIVLAAGRRMAARLSPVFGRPWLPIVYAVAGNDRNVLRSTVTKQSQPAGRWSPTRFGITSGWSVNEFAAVPI